MSKIKQWREDQEEARAALVAKFQLPVSEARMKQVLDEDVTSLQEILTSGLDVGTIVECIIPVTMEKHPEYGWVFVCATGEMFRVPDYI